MRYTDAELLDGIRELAGELGRQPTLAEYRERGPHGTTTLFERFGSWRGAVAVAGFDPCDPTSEMTVADLVAELRRLGTQKGRRPTAAEMDAEGAYAVATYRRRFGTWSNALEAAGYEPIRLGRATDEELIAELQRVNEVCERPSRASPRWSGWACMRRARTSGDSGRGTRRSRRRGSSREDHGGRSRARSCSRISGGSPANSVGARRRRISANTGCTRSRRLNAGSDRGRRRSRRRGWTRRGSTRVFNTTSSSGTFSPTRRSPKTSVSRASDACYLSTQLPANHTKYL